MLSVKWQPLCQELNDASSGSDMDKSGSCLLQFDEK